MSACQAYHGEDICPTADELIPQYMAMLPRGRAWGEGGPGREPGGIIWGYFYALAIVIAAAHQAICALLPEFFCATASGTIAWWNEQYGIDDGCDPFPDLCAKVAALGGVGCDYYVALAAMAGFTVVCNPKPTETSVDGADCVWADGLNSTCPYDGDTPLAGYSGGLTITVMVEPPTPAAPAPVATSDIVPPLADRLYADGALTCLPGVTDTPAPPPTWPDITGLQCLFARVAPAHARVTFDFAYLPL